MSKALDDIPTDPADPGASENRRLTRAAGAIGLATLASRVLGFVRDAVIAWSFGTGFSSDAFLAAFRLPNLFRRVVGEGALSSAFVPVLAEAHLRHGHAEARAIVGAAARFFAAALAVVCALGWILAPWVVGILAPGFPAPKLELTLGLTRLMIPYLFAVGMAALVAGALNVYGSFAGPALSPCLPNIAMIAAVLLVAPLLREPIEGLAAGVLVGGFAQFAFQLPFLARHRLSLRGGAGLFHPALVRVLRRTVPAALGGAVYQVNILVGTLLASLLPEGSVSYLYYAERLVEFPLGVVAIAVATAVLPSMAREAAAGDHEALKATFGYALRTVSFISLPATVGLIVLGEPIVTVLFVRGEFGAASAQLTCQALSYYALGLWAFSAVRIVTAAFFALQDSQTPVRMAGICILANIVLGVVLMKPLSHGGLALAATLASFLNLGLLLLALRRKLAAVAWRPIAVSLGRSLVSALIMCAGVIALAQITVFDGPRSGAGLAAGLAACIGAGIVLYAGAAAALRSPELAHLLSHVTKGDRRS